MVKKEGQDAATGNNFHNSFRCVLEILLFTQSYSDFARVTQILPVPEFP